MQFEFNDGRMFADIDDGVCIIIDSHTGIYFGMDEESSKVFEAICDFPIEEICSFVEKKYHRDIKEPLNNFSQMLLNKEIIRLSHKEKCGFIDDLNLNFSEWTCQTYEDAQDLIMADPIHDVDENEGWSPLMK